MKKRKHNYVLLIPNQPGVWRWKAEVSPLQDEQKKKERFERLNALKNKHPKK